MSPDAVFALITSACRPHECLKQIPVSAFEKIRARHLPESQGHINGVLMDIISRAYNSDSKLGKKYIYICWILDTPCVQKPVQLCLGRVCLISESLLRWLTMDKFVHSENHGHMLETLGNMSLFLSWINYDYDDHLGSYSHINRNNNFNTY
jgi:hypothetical protein